MISAGSTSGSSSAVARGLKVGVVGGAVSPAALAHGQRGAGNHAGDLGVVLALVPWRRCRSPRTRRWLGRVAGEVADRGAEFLLDRPSEGVGFVSCRTGGSRPQHRPGRPATRCQGTGRVRRRSRRVGRDASVPPRGGDWTLWASACRDALLGDLGLEGVALGTAGPRRKHRGSTTGRASRAFPDGTGRMSDPHD